MSDFTASLLSADPPISGLDQSIIIPGRRLHFTLGVMALKKTRVAATSTSDTHAPEGPTLEAAISFLHSLKPKIDEILAKSPSPNPTKTDRASLNPKLRVTLNTMDVMKLEKGDMAHVVWVGPEGGNSTTNSAQWETRRLREVCDLIHNSFKDAGFVVDDRRPLKLHCTIINTTYRKPKPRGGKRLPFSYRGLVEAPRFKGESSTGNASLATSSSLDSQGTRCDTQRRTVRTVDFGTYEIDQVQICEMGSWGSEGEYVSVGSIDL